KMAFTLRDDLFQFPFQLFHLRRGKFVKLQIRNVKNVYHAVSLCGDHGQVDIVRLIITNAGDIVKQSGAIIGFDLQA
ncbi:MAG: hypothetical protein ABIO60_05295, partial [Aquaticitalea sp.]